MYTGRLSILCALLAAMLFTPIAAASLNEKPVMDDINDIIAVLHGLERRIIEIKRERHTIRAALAVTQKQYKALNDLIKAEKAKGNEEQAGMYMARLLLLKKHNKKLTQFNFDALYKVEIDKIEKKIALFKLTLEARKTEYRTLFGKEPEVNLSYQNDLKRIPTKRPDAHQYIRYGR
jgi:hypothetical protein